MVAPLALTLCLALQTPVDIAPPTPAAPLTDAAPAAPAPWTLWGSVEGYGQWNFNTPSFRPTGWDRRR